MAYLNNHVNVFRSCLALLNRKGWKIEIIPGPYEEEDSLLDSYSAERDGTRIVADTPLELLGLATIHEYHHPHDDESYWWIIEENEPGLCDRLEDEALERGFFEYRERDFNGWKKSIKKSINDVSARDDDATLHEWLGISEQTLKNVMSEYPDLFS